MKPNKQYRAALATRPSVVKPHITNKAYAPDPIPGSGYVGRQYKRPGSDKGQGLWRSVTANDQTGRF